ncbi:NGEF protein, partial [Atractosteus spatula]|nr:NGEF protein [Atractosteus spatula]
MDTLQLLHLGFSSGIFPFKSTAFLSPWNRHHKLLILLPRAGGRLLPEKAMQVFPPPGGDASFAMNVLLSKWSKSQDAPDRQSSAGQTQEEDDEDESDHVTGNRIPIRRNSRFYSSMRRKRRARGQAGSGDQPPENDAQVKTATDSPSSNNTGSSCPSKPRVIVNPPRSPQTPGPASPFRPGALLPSNGEPGTQSSQQIGSISPPVKRDLKGGWQDKKAFLLNSQQRSLSSGIPQPRSGHQSPRTQVETLTEQVAACSVHGQKSMDNEGRDSEEANDLDSISLRLVNNRDGDAAICSSIRIIKNMEVPFIDSAIHFFFFQKSMFELVTSEESYNKSLKLLESHFLKNPVLLNTLSQSDVHFIFSNIEEVMKASERFLSDLEKRLEKGVVISDVCDIVYDHAANHFHVFVTYVSNQSYQEQAYRRILQENAAFRTVMANLENDSKCKGLSFNSFLILPFQRITRLKLLVQNILKKAEEGSEIEANAVKAHYQLAKIVRDCNEGVRKMNRTEELICIEKTLDFKSKSVPVISHSRWLLKRGALTHMSNPKNTRTFRNKKLFQPLYLFLFNDLLLITKKSSNGEKFQVLDSSTRAMLRTEDKEDQGQALANIFSLRLMENQNENDVTYMFKASSPSDKRRWICALTPKFQSRLLTSNSNHGDSPQVQCIQSYSSQEPDEMSVEMADIINVLEKTEDGWMMGERLHDGEKGWFPSRVVEEIQNQELRAQYLRECQRIQQAEGNGVRLMASRGRRLRNIQP